MSGAKRSKGARPLLALAFAVVCLVVASPAAASHEGEDSGGETGFVAGTAALIGLSPFTSVTSTIGTTVGGGVTLLVVLLNASDEDSARKEQFIRRNALALQRDITVGGGTTARTLAAAFRVERRNFEEFGAMLRSRREMLVPLTNREKLDRRRAVRFFREIARGMRARPKLRDDLRETGLALRADH